MEPIERVAVVGATGMLARPTIRRLVREGFRVRAVVRDVDRGRALLPAACQLVEARIEDEASMQRALRDSDAIYLNLSPPRSPTAASNPELVGSRLVARLAARLGIRRVLKISALGCPDARAEWWAIETKAQADDAVMTSGVPFTIFRPTWFMESIQAFAVARRVLIVPAAPVDGLHWIAGDDYGRMVAAALRTEDSLNRIYPIQGPEPVGLAEAFRRFCAAMGGRWIRVPMPRRALAVAARFSSEARYLRDLLDWTFRWVAPYPGGLSHAALGAPLMKIEDYAAYVKDRRDC